MTKFGADMRERLGRKVRDFDGCAPFGGADRRWPLDLVKIYDEIHDE